MLRACNACAPSQVREFQVLRSLRHPNIIRLYGAYETPRNLYLVTELACGGTLMKRLGDTSAVYSEELVIMHVRTMLDAVAYMHGMNCVHRDLKPENVLLSDMTDQAIIKIVDLGLSRFFDESKPMRTICGTHKFLAPELVQVDRGELKGYDKAIDMCAPPELVPRASRACGSSRAARRWTHRDLWRRWGVGLLSFIMLFGFNPFARKTHPETHAAIVDCKWSFPDGYTVSGGGKAFVKSLLRAKPTERPSAKESRGNPWFHAPASPHQLLTAKQQPVKQQLNEFNAEHTLNKLVKGPHRRLDKAHLEAAKIDLCQEDEITMR